MRSRCSSSGPGRRASACPSTSRPARWWCRSAGGWTGCRWRSSWPRPGCGRCRWPSLHDRLDQRFRLLTGGSRTALERQQTLRATVELVLFAADRRRADAAGAPVGVRRRLRPGGRRGGVRVRRPRRAGCRRPARVAGGQEPGRGRARRGRALRYRLLETIRLFAAERLAEAGDDAGRRGRRGALRAFPGRRRGGGASSDRAGAGQLAGPAGRRSGQPAARRPACGRPTRSGTALVLRLGVALYRYWMARSRQQEAFGLLVPVLRAARRPRGPRRCSRRRWSPPRAPRCSLTSPRHGTLRNRRSRSPAAWATTGCSSGPSRHCAPRVIWAGEPETGLPFGQESVERARRLGDDVLLGVSLLLLSPDRRPGPVPAAGRRGDRLHRTIRRPAHQLLPAQQRRRSRPEHRGHPRRPGSPGSRGASRAADRTGGRSPCR